MLISSVKCSICGKEFSGRGCELLCAEHEKIPVQECKIKLGDKVLIMYRNVRKETLTPRNAYTIYFEIEEVKELEINRLHGWNFNRLHSVDDCCYVINDIKDITLALEKYNFEIYNIINGN